mmetsp:Transcript_41850/g.81839  ORF Transcript_41850/g.81839 Transcript_41850/m.81839 type:complete len:215 (-) Transcript_41850:16-660(-)|eukprot:CAMPEP_0173381534 /NCGR_PEP_ID=MMETSP1356-20130122/3914_1 /TAXON_ID=77927 ORGANISM="Hemiselmis virescens, Strain PCC157" /NCGR_SAMPLE_ID=MMETSP1356 /ASSEMBLY_ACC=CAM_ASM_000847 /LENGTH=214 /DNA_ID=CAMNT_0014335385 /DNA_START=146 /DNA_END=790 /DNA_ORIENTATION=-
MAAAAGKEDKRPKTNDGKNEFASASGVAPKHETLSDMLFKYVPSDEEAFRRLIKPSLKAQAQALDVAKVAMSGLDSMMAALVQRRRTCGDQIEADLAESAWIDREVAKQQIQVDRITKHREECKKQRDVMVKALADSVTTMQDSVRYCATMKQKTNSNISRLTRTMVPTPKDNFLKSGIQEKDDKIMTNTMRNSQTVSKTQRSNALSTAKSGTR